MAYRCPDTVMAKRRSHRRKHHQTDSGACAGSPQGSHLIFIDVPRNNDQYAYVFGIGLKEALIQRYGGRQDLVVIRFPKREDLGTAIPERDFVFQYHTDTGVLEKLRAVRKKKAD